MIESFDSSRIDFIPWKRRSPQMLSSRGNMREWHLLSLRVGDILFTLETNQDQKCSMEVEQYCPARGVMGYAMTSFEDQPGIMYNMGATSIDISRYDGEYEHVFKSTTAGVTIKAPQLGIDTVAAVSGLCNFSG
ncbi:uncharacterized protein LOC143452215 isoform X2 [Clavelina lepadiformis]|uniref:uncharacterized protein LOC143452215 isoform X2 n=1 Tax=Clavelina lepadiformis TaxID=159417 RepID=UPI004042C965